MLKIKNDFYAKYLDTDGRFWEVKKGIYRIQVEKRKNLLGFKNYDEVELKDKMFIDVSKNKISSAYRVRTYCNYKDGKYDLSNIADNTVILFPDLETKRKIGFHIYNDNSVDVPYDKFVIEVTDVWEERTLIKGFKFEEEPIVYLKKNGVWLVEHQKEEIVQNQEKLEKQFSENKIDKEEYDKKTKENISQWEKTLSVYNDVESFTEKHPLITKEEVNELKELQQQKSFAGNSVGKKDLENTKKINARQTETIEKLLKKEDEIRKLIDDFIANCPDCQNPKLFLDALVQIAQNVGRKEAENSIKKWEEYFRTGVASTEAIKVNICLGLEKKIEIRSKNGYFEKIYEQIPRRTYKSSMEALGFYNTYSYADAIVINGKKINYTGEIKIKPKEEFNICCVELKAGNLTYNAKETNQIWFLNDKNIYTAKLIFSSKDDIDLVWKYYYIKNKNETKENVIKEYDKIHKTNFYNLILRKVKK